MATEALQQAGFVEVTTTEEGKHRAHSPVPVRAIFSLGILALVREVFDVEIRARFDNGTARYRVVDVGYNGTLVAELLEVTGDLGLDAQP